MITLINTNRMTPPIAPVGLDYISAALRQSKIEVDILDLCLADDAADVVLRRYFARHSPELVGLSFRNVDDCFWPSAQWFVPALAEIVGTIRNLTDAPVVLGGVGFSVFSEQIVRYTGADFGIRGDGEQPLVSLVQQLRGGRAFEKVDGLLWRADGEIHSNRPAWPERLSLGSARDAVDNLTYFKKGGQAGIETKRGCNRQCIYCADPLAKGPALRLRDPREVADEAQVLLDRGIDVLHICDSEFNIPRSHALAVCAEFVRRSLPKRLRWYAYMAVRPFDAELAEAMARAGCVGIDFTADAACDRMLQTYRDSHLRRDIAEAVKLCRKNRITVMLDLLLGGPGETPETAAETIEFIKRIGPDCAGASLGVRIYPGTQMARIVEAEAPLDENPAVRRKYPGPIDCFKPTFYISAALGAHPAALIRRLIAGDERFFEPMLETDAAAAGNVASTDHNYNENLRLTAAIADGFRGAYWDILRRLKTQ